MSLLLIILQFTKEITNKKDAIRRLEPNFMYRTLISKGQVQERETCELIEKMIDGSVDKLFASFLGRKNLIA